MSICCPDMIRSIIYRAKMADNNDLHNSIRCKLMICVKYVPIIIEIDGYRDAAYENLLICKLDTSNLS